MMHPLSFVYSYFTSFKSARQYILGQTHNCTVPQDGDYITTQQRCAGQVKKHNFQNNMWVK
jgi:hypothetical protein